MKHGAPLIYLIDSDPGLLYLIERYAERGGYKLAAQLARPEVPVLVCASLNDASRAGELGAHRSLVHPLTYDGFLAAL